MSRWDRAGVKVLKIRLSEYVRMVASGKTVLVTDRGRVVADLRPPQGRGPIKSDALFADAMRRGWRAAPIVFGKGHRRAHRSLPSIAS